MSRLNLDVLSLIIDNVGDTSTLFSLLTVNKQVFHLACCSLYRDPGFFLMQTSSDSLEKAVLAFFQLVLTISPINDDDIDLLKQAFNIKPVDGHPMFDYLSAVRIVWWGDAMEECISRRWEEFRVTKSQYQKVPRGDCSRSAFTKQCLTKAMIYHQLGSIVELEIEPIAIEEYILRASELKCLTKVFIARDLGLPPNKDAYPLAIRLVKAVQYHHGQHQLRDCRIYEDPASSAIGKLLPQQIELDSLLPLPDSLKRLQLVAPQPMDRFMVQLSSFFFIERKISWRQISQHYPTLPPGHILQRCRELTYLEAEIYETTTDGAEFFTWAAQEAQDRATEKWSVAPAVPLKHLRLFVHNLTAGSTQKILTDALAGFARSLSTLCVILKPQNSSPTAGEEHNGLSLSSLIRDERILTLPRLRELKFETSDPSLFDIRLLQNNPKLTRLTVILDHPAGTESPSQSWPLVHLYNLTELTLGGLATNSFDPTALAIMPSLDYLSLMQAAEDPSPELLSRMSRWTWDWHLPWLTYLSVECAMDGWFTLKILRSCPKLVRLDLQSTSPCWLKVQSVLDDLQNDVFPNVEELLLRGEWDIAVEDLNELVQRVLPCLVVLELANIGQNAGRQAIITTRGHPTLRRVVLASSILSPRERSEMGLRQNIHPSEGESSDGDEAGYCVYHFGLLGDHYWW